MAHITMALMALMENGSVEAKSGSFVVCPQICRREILDVSELVRNFSGCYAVKDLTLAFVCEEFSFHRILIKYVKSCVMHVFSRKISMCLSAVRVNIRLKKSESGEFCKMTCVRYRKWSLLKNVKHSVKKLVSES